MSQLIHRVREVGVAAVALALVAGCKAPLPFRCDDASDCAVGETGGRCEPQGFCSHFDTGCASGWRFGEFAEDLTGQCTESEADGRPLFAEVVAAGAFHSCAIDPAGTVFCWGNNVYGQLGTGDRLHRSGPTPVDLPLPARALSLAGAHSCAVLRDGSVHCWGENGDGQLGLGNEAESLLPTRLDLEGVVSLATSDYNEEFDPPLSTSCAVDEMGALFCWGDNRDGQLGDGTTEDRNVPARVRDVPAVRAVSIAKGTVCALTQDSEVLCWGRGKYGALGSGSEEDSLSPVSVPVADVVAIDSARKGTCAVTEAGDVQCWGQNERHVLAVPSANSGSPVLTPQPSLVRDDIELAYSTGCSRSDAGVLSCWGSALFGLFGPEVRQSNVPVTVPLPDRVTDVAIGSGHVCATTERREVYCLGAIGEGYLGDGRSAVTLEPVLVRSNIEAASISGARGCAVASNGENACWGRAGDVLGAGDDDRWEVWAPTVIDESGPLWKPTVAHDTACGITPDGATFCWGESNRGGLGSGATVDEPKPVAVVGLPDPGATPAIGGAVGDPFGCAVIADGRVFCWGEASDLRLGAERSDFSPTAVPVAAATTATSIHIGQGGGTSAMGDAHVCAAQTGVDERLLCWGANKWGQLGRGVQSEEELPAAADDPCPGQPFSVALGGEHTCALCEDSGEVFCWGRNDLGQLGVGDDLVRTRPEKLSGLTGIDEIAAAGNSTCARAGNRVWCWGANASGQLGSEPSPSILRPQETTAFAGLGAVQSLVLGGPPWPHWKFFADQGTTCAVAGGDLYCFGSTYNALTADFSQAFDQEPTRVMLE